MDGKIKAVPVAVWWQGTNNVDYWVKERGVNILWWDKAIYSSAGDWEAMHQDVEKLRTAGFNVWVIRQPAYLIGPDKLDINFDIKWKSHLYAFDLDDEFEDKISGGNLWSNPQPIVDYVKQRVADYHKWMPDMPIMANFNGTHIGNDLKDRYLNIVGAGIDIVCSDCYPCAAQQVKPDGTLLYPNVVGGAINGSVLLKQWFPHKPVWVFLECCNQDIMKAGTDGWSAPWKSVGSRAPTSQELWQILYYWKQAGGDGIAWFPQAHGGAINDATDPALIPTMVQMAYSLNPPKPVTPVIVPAKKLVKTISIYDDWSIDVK